MRIAHVSDTHLDSSPGGRMQECIRVHDWIADDMEARGVDLALHGGDMYERRSTPDERRAAAHYVRRVGDFAPQIIVRGNHDQLRDLELLSQLEAPHEIIVEESAGVHVVAGCIVGCLAWPTKASVIEHLRRIGMDASIEAGEQAGYAALRSVLLGLREQMAEVAAARGMPDAPRVLLAHAMVRGATVSTGQPMVGCEFELGLEDLRLAQADVCLLGHIHKPQEWSVEELDWVATGAAPVFYAGSPRRTAFGEVEDKSYLVLEFDGRTLVSAERVPTPCAQMHLLQANYVAADDIPCDGGERCMQSGLYFQGSGPDDINVDGAEVRLRYVVEPDQREAAAAAAAEVRDSLLARGAVGVKVEGQATTTDRARAPEVAAARTLADKLRAYWRARDATPAAERESALLSKLAELDTTEVL